LRPNLTEIGEAHREAIFGNGGPKLVVDVKSNSPTERHQYVLVPADNVDGNARHGRMDSSAIRRGPPEPKRLLAATAGRLTADGNYTTTWIQKDRNDGFYIDGVFRIIYHRP
jgi:hypothetical protein